MIDYKRITFLRTHFLNKTQAEFSEEIGVPIATYQRFERGESKLTGDALLNIMDLYGVRREWLKTGEEPIFEKDQKSSLEPPSGYSLVKTDDIMKMQQRMIELQDQVIAKQVKQNQSPSTSETSNISK